MRAHGHAVAKRPQEDSVRTMSQMAKALINRLLSRKIVRLSAVAQEMGAISRWYRGVVADG